METNHISVSKALTWAITAAIVIVVNLLFYYTIATVYPEPKYEGFCPRIQEVYNDAEACVSAGGQWSNYQLSPREITTTIEKGQPTGWCDANFTCNENYQQANSVYNRNVFIVLIVLSIVTLAVGAFLIIPVLSYGFLWAGVLSLIVASLRYWSDADNWIRVIILVIALALLIWITLKKYGRSAT